MPLVTLSAPYGAGGSQVGPLVADRLGVPFVDRAVPRRVAERMAVPLDHALSRDESIGSWLARSSVWLGHVGSVLSAVPPPGGLEDEDRFRRETEAVLREHAAGAGAVVLGRAGALVLRDVRGALHVRLQGSVEARVRQAMRLEHVDRADGDAAPRADRHRARGLRPPLLPRGPGRPGALPPGARFHRAAAVRLRRADRQRGAGARGPLTAPGRAARVATSDDQTAAARSGGPLAHPARERRRQRGRRGGREEQRVVEEDGPRHRRHRHVVAGPARTSTGSPAATSPAVTTRRYAPGRPASAKRLTMPGSPKRMPSLAHGSRGWHDLELGGAGPPALADPGARDVDALDREVLAEGARRELAAQCLPPTTRRPRRRTRTPPCPGRRARAGRPARRLPRRIAGDAHPAGDGLLADRAHQRPAAADGDLARASDVHRAHAAHVVSVTQPWM